METRVHFICITVASFAILAQPAVAQGANTTLPLLYPGQVLQGDGSQTCPSEAQRGITRNEVQNATRSLLRESVVPSCSKLSPVVGLAGDVWPTSTCQTPPSSVPQCGGSTPPHTGCVEEGPPLVAARGSTTPLVMSSMTRCVGGLLATRLDIQRPSIIL